MGFASWSTPGTFHRFVVPAGVTRLGIEVKGAGNGHEAGGLVQGWITVRPDDFIYMMVGEQGGPSNGRQAGAGGWGGGGYGGTGRGNQFGGDGGGGASGVSVGGAIGWWRAIAGGAGGRAGDGGHGGAGGADKGQPGDVFPTTTPSNVPAQGGDGETHGAGGKNTKADPTYDGEAGTSGLPYAIGGRGGQAGPNVNSIGGGGGGGGWGTGGGGAASGHGGSAGGGGGGSNYVGDMEVMHNWRGGGNVGNGYVAVSWDDSPGGDYDPNDPNQDPGAPDLPVNNAPPPPSNLMVDNVPLGSDTTTLAMNRVTFTANLANPDAGETTQMVLRIVAADNDDTTQEWNFTLGYSTYYSDWVPNVADGSDPPTAQIGVSGLWPNQKYYVRAWSLDSTGRWSESGDPAVEGGFASGSFWTNRTPNAPVMISPTDNRIFEIIDNIYFQWSLVDPDDDDSQSAAQVRIRRLTRPGDTTNADWVIIADIRGPVTSHTQLASTLVSNQFYVWSVRSCDSQGLWSEWSYPTSFFVEAGTTPPVIIFPRRGEAVIANNSTEFRWQYLDPITGSSQVRADLRVRVVGTEDWIVYYGEPSPGQPGEWPGWVFPLDTFIEGYHYEWGVRTVNSALLTSEWSNTEDFWATARPGDGVDYHALVPAYESVAPPLGCGNNRVFVFDRGGKILRGEITPIATLRYNRVRDDISSCTILTNGFGSDCGALMSELRSWMHEIVIFRDGVRVWEGPIVRISSKPGEVEIEAKDPMVYVYRRIMRQGYNDTYHEDPDGARRGGISVVRRATLTVMNALAYDDPNVLRWVTEVAHADDAIQHRAVPDYAKMAWEEIDDLAANAGLDYTTLGRRIIFWDTHRPLGRLPEMRDEHFSQPVHVTEYGMQLANYFAVTNNNGVYGVATRGMSDVPGALPPYYGWVEQLVSAFGETEGDDGTDLSEAAKAKLEETLAQQADRGIAHRWPTPLVVRVPDNATIQPDVNLGFDQLVPGVWIPVRAQATIRSVAQWQKLDSVAVEQTGDGGEKIMVTMSPAPNGGNDPDADAAAEEAGQ